MSRPDFFLVQGSSDLAPTMMFADLDSAESALQVQFWELPDGTYLADPKPGTAGEQYWTGIVATREQVLGMLRGDASEVSGAA